MPKTMTARDTGCVAGVYYRCESCRRLYVLVLQRGQRDCPYCQFGHLYIDPEKADLLSEPVYVEFSW